MLSTVFEKDSIESYFSNPFVAKGDKLAALQAVAGEAGLSETTLNLFGVMAENNRMNLVSEVAEADAGTVPCSVESAIPLTASQQADVADALQGMLEPGQSAQISTSVNPELMGGMIVSIGDKYTEMKYIDMSVASKVKKYTDLLRQSA